MTTATLTEERFEEIAQEKVDNQYVKCRRDYYKSILTFFLGSLSTIIVIVSGIILWSYEPLKDIAVLKVELRIVQEKLDLIIKQNGIKKKGIIFLPDSSLNMVSK